jgi:hypothetical protein
MQIEPQMSGCYKQQVHVDSEHSLSIIHELSHVDSKELHLKARASESEAIGLRSGNIVFDTCAPDRYQTRRRASYK